MTNIEEISTMTYKLVGELACQIDSFLQTLDTFVIRCDAVENKTALTKNKPKKDDPPHPKNNNNGNENENEKLYEIVCHDSVLFPEGGGQPCDYGTLTVLDENKNTTNVTTTIEIKNVQRHKDTCVLYSPVPLAPGTAVRQQVDWARRLDHMQQHTAQHVLSRIVEDETFLKLKTVSWSLTHPYCFIVVDLTPILEAAAEIEKESATTLTNHEYAKYVPFVAIKEKKVKQEMLQYIQDACNTHIAADCAVRCDVIHTHRDAYEMETATIAANNNNNNNNQKKEENAEKLGQVRSRGIPADVSGPIRKITIQGVDACTCCGTHLAHLSQLYALQVLPMSYEEVKNNTVKIFFSTGERLLRSVTEMFGREKQLISLLGGVRPELFVAEVQKQNKERTEMEKTVKRCMAELALYAAEGVKATYKNIIQHRNPHTAEKEAAVLIALPLKEDVDVEFYNTIRNALDGKHAIQQKKNTKKKKEDEKEEEKKEKEEDYSKVVLLSAWASPGATAAQKTLEGQVMISGDGNKKEDLEKIVAQVKLLLSPSSSSDKKAQPHDDDDDEKNKKNYTAENDTVIKGGISKSGFRGKGNIYHWKNVEQFDWTHFLSSS